MKILTVYLRFDCEHFELKIPDFPLADEVKEDIVDTEQQWLLFEEFNGGLDELRQNDWITFRYVRPNCFGRKT